jgi:hypothetical protein
VIPPPLLCPEQSTVVRTGTLLVVLPLLLVVVMVVAGIVFQFIRGGVVVAVIRKLRAGQLLQQRHRVKLVNVRAHASVSVRIGITAHGVLVSGALMGAQ